MTSHYRLFVASPGDVKSERETLSRVVTEINQTHGSPLGYSLNSALGNTRDTRRRTSTRCNQRADRELRPFCWDNVASLWDTDRSSWIWNGRGNTGAHTAHGREITPCPSCSIFRQRPFMPRQIDEVDQLKSVLLFRQELERKALVWDYAGPKVFADEIRKHLCLRMERLVDARGHKSRATPDNESIDDLRALWDHMVPELQKAFSVAYNENRRAGIQYSNT